MRTPLHIVCQVLSFYKDNHFRIKNKYIQDVFYVNGEKMRFYTIEKAPYACLTRARGHPFVSLLSVMPARQ